MSLTVAIILGILFLALCFFADAKEGRNLNRKEGNIVTISCRGCKFKRRTRYRKCKCPIECFDGEEYVLRHKDRTRVNWSNKNKETDS